MGNLAANKLLTQINQQSTISSTTLLPVEIIAHQSL